MKIDFKKDFNDYGILSRGFEYYTEKRVKYVFFKGNITTAKVLGNDAYDVSVEIDNGLFIDGDCTSLMQVMVLTVNIWQHYYII